ncbi:MAG: ParB/RepB/Spo0J family partition protein [Rickettsiaceae bacterium]
MKNRALGKGLSSLLKEEIVPVEGDSSNILDITQIEVGKYQPRKNFDQEKLQELANSIITNGLLQPIIVNFVNNGKYQIIAGERRYRACKMVGLKEIPVIIRNLSDQEILEIALIENIQREELTAIEEAESYAKLMNEFGYTQARLADSLGKSRSHVANILRLNNLPDSIKLMINNGQLTMGHARCLIGLENAEELANKVVSNDLNVRQTEELTRKIQSLQKTKKQPSENNSDSTMNDDFIILGQSLSEKYGVKVVVENSWNGGKISFYYSNLEELDLILTKIS